MTELSDAYREIAARHLTAAKVLLDSGLHEIAVFHCYHALESVACAALASRGVVVPFNHRRKLDIFGRAFRRMPFSRGASVVAAIVGPARNQALYPDAASPAHWPSNRFTQASASEMLRRVEGMTRTITTTLGL
jgi:HEPN domain-containing protein